MKPLAYGSEYPTPHIDSLADNGIRFDQGHATRFAPLPEPGSSQALTISSIIKRLPISIPDCIHFLNTFVTPATPVSLSANGKWRLEHGGKIPDLGFDEHLVWQLERSLKEADIGSPPSPKTASPKPTAKMTSPRSSSTTTS